MVTALTGPWARGICFRVALSASLTLLALSPVQSASITAASASIADVSAAISLASDGDTVVLPITPTPVTWTSALSLTKGITLLGAGIGSTIIVDGTSNHNLISIRGIGSTQSVRVSGIEFRHTGTFSTNSVATISANIQSVSTPNTRFDNLYFNDTYGLQAISLVGGSCLGVIDHCTFYTTHLAARVYVEHDSWQGVGSYGDNSWAQPLGLGTNQWLFIEDCTFSGQHAATALDACGGARIVFRHNTVKWANIGGHGTDTTCRARAVRCVDIYNNIFQAGVQGQPDPGGMTNQEERAFAIHLRGGSKYVHHNVFESVNGTSSGYNTMVAEDFHRIFETCASSMGGFNYTDGVNTWDNIDTADHTNNGYGGSTGGVFATGKHTGASGASVLTDSSKNFPVTGFTNNAASPNGPIWANTGYILRNITQNKWAQISTNTATTVTTYNNGPSALSFNLGDSYEIRRVISVLDGPNSGTSDLLSGFSASPAGWAHNAKSPTYVWANDFYGNGNNNGQPMYAYNKISVPGVNFFAQSAAMDCNIDANGVCQNTPNPANVPAGYTTYQYPHPLVSGASAGATPSPPQNLRVSGP
jgi:hypothetical protein